MTLRHPVPPLPAPVPVPVPLAECCYLFVFCGFMLYKTPYPYSIESADKSDGPLGDGDWGRGLGKGLATGRENGAWGRV